jgi:hypothetical protein
MSDKNKSTRIIFKKMIYVVQLGTLYVWDTASSIRSGCVDRALKYFDVNNESELTKKGAEIILISTKEVK